jgi:hypothetical protein
MAEKMDMMYVQQNILPGVEELRGSHNAGKLCETTFKVLRRYGLKNARGCITADDASVNVAMYLGMPIWSWNLNTGRNKNHN